jgi:thiamine-monophosphate kinase
LLSTATRTLRDLGEREILNQLIIPRFPAIANQVGKTGDDCAVLPAPPTGQLLVMTTDPCPTPVVCLLETPNFYHYGRMTVLINISDLAAMGAEPLGIMISTVMPEKMPVAEYERFLEGVADASSEWNCPVVGGNIKDGPFFTASGSALGSVAPEYLLRRTGMGIGDHVCVVGEMGLFWAACLARLFPSRFTDNTHDAILNKALYKPDAKIMEGRALADSRLVTACIDSSDGVGSCLYELAAANTLDIIIRSSSIQSHPAVESVANAVDIDVRKLMLSWGNWELVCTIPASAVREARVIIESLGTPFYDIGEVQAGKGNVWLEESGGMELLANFASERFSQTSVFTHGLDAYYQYLRTQQLTIRD